MGSNRSKEDEVQRISTSVFVTNFPEVFSAKDLWNTCKQYGQVVDAYIPNRRSKAVRKANKNFDRHPSYVGVVKQKMMFQQTRDDDNKPSIVLDDSCVLQCDYSLSLTGKVLDFGSLLNLKMVLTKEGFENFNLKYLGGFWVLIKFCSKQALENFKSHVGVGSWFSSLEYASNAFLIDERVVWVDIEGVPLKGDESDEDTFKDEFGNDNSKVNMNFNSEGESDKEEVQEMIFSSHKVESKRRNDINDDDDISNGSLNYPLGITPIEEGDKKFDKVDKLNGKEQGYTENANEQAYNVEEKSNKGMSSSKEEDKESQCSGHFRRVEGPKTRGSILQLLDDVVKVGQTMGYQMDGCVSNIEEIIKSRGLVEVPLGACAFTWCHKLRNKMSKLDRFLISKGLMRMCPNISAITLDRYLSDHMPILLREVCHDYGPIPFRVFHYWFEWEGFDELVKDTWSKSTIIDNNAISKFLKKLKYLKEQIRLWVRAKKESACMQRSNLKEKLESMEIAQKAKIKWSIEGDENSNYFHDILSKKRNQLATRGILAEGVWIDDPNSVKNEFLSHFKERFDRPCSSRLILDMNYLNRLNSDQMGDLERNVTKEEIKRAVWDCGTDKSPGPDGFTFGFYRRYWDIMEKDVVNAVSYFFTEGMFSKCRNASFIALIPKMQDANVVKDFRLISLIGSLYKIIAKILANRLVMVLGDLVSEVQSAFIANRQILDGPFILNELIQWCKSKKKQTMIFKIDFEKAYDSVRWDYLDDVLEKFGFGSKWRGWIHNCLHSSKGSILVNGSPTDEFHFRRGLKQGDPLSPFLFILVMESLHLSFQNVVDEGLFKGVSWSESNIITIVNALDCFHKASGLRMNLQKSKLLGIVVEDEKVSRAAMKMGCCTLKTPFSYLGIKVGGMMTRITSWDEIVAKLHSRLSKWKLKTLSIGGRLTLLKSVLGSTPIYYMSMFKVPFQVLKCLEDIRRQFFNGADPKEKKMSWVKWSRVLASKDKGGLGVSSFFALNRALLLKWVWRFRYDKNSLWTRFIKALYGNSGSIETPTKVAYSSTWFNIVTEFSMLKNQGMNLLSFMKKKVGDGHDTFFWEEVWMGDMTFKSRFPRVYALESDKKITVAAKMNHNGLGFSLRRAPRDVVEMEQLRDMIAFLEGVKLPAMHDRWIWALVGSGEFLVASARKFIDDHHLTENDIDFKLKMIDHVKHEADREVEISTYVANTIEEIIKNAKGRQTIIETLEKVGALRLSSKTKAFLINVRQDEMKTLEHPMEIMKDISEHLNLKHIFCEHMKNM
ncbi:RNA-directed DNA polymerase, eukaryota [Tanacetum coccineum]